MPEETPASLDIPETPGTFPQASWTSQTQKRPGGAQEPASPAQPSPTHMAELSEGIHCPSKLLN